MSDLRNISQRLGYVSEAIWKEWLDAWNSPEYKRKREQAKKNTRKGKESEPAGATHTSGSISHGETFERLTAHLGRALDPHELFMYTHTRQHDGTSWIDQHAQDAEEEYARIVAEIESQQNCADEFQAFFQAVGGANNTNRIYGLGAAGARYFNAACSSSSGTHGASSSTASSDPRLYMQSRLDKLQSTVDGLIADLQQRYGQEEGHNHTNRLNLSTSASQVHEVQQRFEEFQIQMRDQIGSLQDVIVRMQQQIDKLELGDTNEG
ncbi:uncharacterized protein [Euphorbia lathyris]|uniref:uncharacterized protein n=1 Tax=Euphorbia lathyris TaxID=212925 RepID=UPI003314125A